MQKFYNDLNYMQLHVICFEPSQKEKSNPKIPYLKSASVFCLPTNHTNYTNFSSFKKVKKYL